jgi:hypothetical protein
MTGKVLGGAALVLHFAVVIFIGYGMQLPVQQPVTPPTVAEVPMGPQCTIRYPRGFKFTKRDAKLKPCRTLDVDGVVWDRCSRRIPT